MQTIIKPTAGHHDGVLIALSRIIFKLRKATEISIGYQDETGFNFGARRVGKDVMRQPAANQRES
jgi:hypothetical protein